MSVEKEPVPPSPEQGQPSLPFRVDLTGAPEGFHEIDILGLSSFTRGKLMDAEVTRVTDLIKWHLRITQAKKVTGVINAMVKPTYDEVGEKLGNFKNTVKEQQAEQLRRGETNPVVVIEARLFAPKQPPTIEKKKKAVRSQKEHKGKEIKKNTRAQTQGRLIVTRESLLQEKAVDIAVTHRQEKKDETSPTQKTDLQSQEEVGGGNGEVEARKVEIVQSEDKRRLRPLSFRVELGGVSTDIAEVHLLGLSRRGQQTFEEMEITTIAAAFEWYLRTDPDKATESPSWATRKLREELEKKLRDFRRTLQQKAGERDFVIDVHSLMPFLLYSLSWTDIEAMKDLKQLDGREKQSLQEFIHETIERYAHKLANRMIWSGITRDAVKKWLRVKEDYISADIYQVFGEDPRGEFIRMNHREKLSLTEIAKFKKVSRKQLVEWFKKSKVRPRVPSEQEVLERFPGMIEVLGEHPRTQLQKLHEEENLSYAEIAKRLKKGQRTISEWMDALDIPQKSKMRRYIEQIFGPHPKKTFEWFYVINKLSEHQMSQMFRVSPTTIRKWMKELGVKARSPKEQLTQKYETLGDNPREVLMELHVKQGLRFSEIGKLYGKNPETIAQWARDESIPLNHDGEGNSKIRATLGTDPKAELVRLLHTLGLSLAEAGRRKRVSYQTISKWAEQYRVEQLDLNERLMRNRLGEDPKKRLEEVFFGEGQRSKTKTARILKLNFRTAVRWLDELDISSTSTQEEVS